jgi:hypothetical protein
LQIRGAIYHHSKLAFHNGLTGTKYLVLLNTPGKNEPYLFVKTTSQKKDKPSTPGCIEDRSLYFIPTGKTFFKKDTWVQLYEIYEIPPNDIDNNKEITVKGALDVNMIDDIVNCLFLAEEENIPSVHKKLLRPPLQQSLSKLQEKFNKNKY